MMNKKGMSMIVVGVLVFFLAVILAMVIYWNMKQAVLYLAPEPDVDCYGLDFNASIIRGPGVDYFEVANLGNLQIVGFYIKRFGDGELYTYEEIAKIIGSGKEDRIVLEKDYGPGKYLIVPRVEGEDLDGQTYLRPCKEIYGLGIDLE